MKDTGGTGQIQRLKVVIHGAVQGVGFRPFIYRLATEIGLTGWVKNSPAGVFIEVEGDNRQLDCFIPRIQAEKPPRSSIHSLEPSRLDPLGYKGFEIRESEASGAKTALLLPDIAICGDCLREIFDPADRRYLYPFTNCTNCGPRYSIIESLPYDRSNTAMKDFRMCGECLEEYENPLDRRFHAQPNACPECGPNMELWDGKGRQTAFRHQAVLETVEALKRGSIAAVKGLGGFHLMVDARNQDAVARLRRLKAREEKPFALMYPALEAVEADCSVSPGEKRLLLSPECPIVLLKRTDNLEGTDIAPSVAPGNPYLGVMLPYTPLHHILLRLFGAPLIATSGNLKDEPICTDENEARERLAGIADIFLVHNRPIVRHVDDSIVRIILGREMVLRRARGYAPLPVNSNKSTNTVLAVGGHLKNTIALAAGEEIFLSQHIGDLETTQAYDAFQEVIESFKEIYEAQPEMTVCDKHPDYISSRYAVDSGLPVVKIQHHFAHIVSCMAENELAEPVLGVSWDGTGYGDDGSIWGGEFLHTDGTGYERAAYFRNFPLPGGEAAVREPKRAAVGLLYQIYGAETAEMKELKTIESFSKLELRNLLTMLERNLNSPLTSSAGRLFDAAASIMGVRQVNSYEGQAAMELEFLVDENDNCGAYPYEIKKSDSAYIIDWEPIFRGIVEDLKQAESKRRISTRFHNTLAEIIAATAKLCGEEKIVLSGGCFQNRYLTETTVKRLQAEGFKPYWHQRIPPNDGGIALGQAVAARNNLGFRI